MASELVEITSAIKCPVVKWHKTLTEGKVHVRLEMDEEDAEALQKETHLMVARAPEPVEPQPESE